MGESQDNGIESKENLNESKNQDEEQSKKSKDDKQVKKNKLRSRSNDSRKKSKSRKRSRSRDKKSKNRRSRDRRSRSRSRKHRRSRDRKSRDRKSRDRKSRDRRSRDRKSREKKSRERKSRERKSRERKSRDRKSKEKSPKKNKNFRFDSPPKELNPENNILASLGGGIPLLNPMLGPQSGDLVQRMQMMSALQTIQNSKVDRKLYVGNLPANMTPQTLMFQMGLQKNQENKDYLLLRFILKIINNSNVKIQQLSQNWLIYQQPGIPITSAWIAADGNYAFVEFRTPEECSAGFCLNNVAIFGQPLKIGRPKTFAAHQATQQIGGGSSQQSVPMNPFNPELLEAVGAQSIDPAVLTGLPDLTDQPIRVHPPSRVLILKNMVQIHELEIDEEYNEIFEDIKEECDKYGTVISIKIPRPMLGEFIMGVGKVFVEYSTIDQAKSARNQLAGRTFSNNTVECSYHNEQLYKDGHLDQFY